jgi:hypothetical protein
MSFADHQANVLAAEQARQQSMGPATLQDRSWPPIPGHSAIDAPPLSAAQLRAINIQFLRSCLASAIANGQSTSCYISGLKELGTGGQ